MAEILFKSQSFTNIDPNIDRSGCYKKGYPVVVMPDGHIWGTEEGFPKFVIVKCPEITVEQTRNYINHWRDSFSYAVIATYPAQGRYTVRVTNSSESVTHINAITLDKIENYLLKWGCDTISFVPYYVQFDIRLWNMVRSDAFWNVDNVSSKVIFELISYDSGTGIGRIKATVPIAWPSNQVIGTIIDRSGTIISSAHPVYIFDIERSVVLEKFKMDVKNKIERIYCRRQFYVTEAVVDYIVNQGGIISVTKTQLLNYIKNKLDE
jgi:hypothetical protein